MATSVEERFAKLSLGTDGKRNEDLTRIILATVYPKPGKTERIIELYQPIIKDGADKEPGTVQFQLFVDINPETGNEEIFTIEKFKNIEALRLHQQGESLKDFNRITAAEDLHAKPVLVHVVKPVSGFAI
ncbi:hypothetical protein GGI43DRAFT_413959 [Trichoderma evansii]